MIKLKYLAVCLLAFVASTTGFAQEVTLTSLLREQADFSAVARWPRPYYKEMQVSSYDRKSVLPGQPGWFANDDRSQYIRTETVNGRRELVMMDADGPGAIVRFWLTTFKRNGNIRIYFDGSKEPAITVPAYDLMKSGLNLGAALLQAHSSYEPKEKGGSTLYLPMPYAKHCKITFEDNDPDNQPRYYQVNYRSYVAGTSVKTFSLQQLDQARKLVDDVNGKLLHPDNAVAGKRINANHEIAPGKQVAIDLPKGSAAVRYLAIKLKTSNNEDYEQALRSTILQIKFDGEQTVWCPVGDFAGSGVGAKPLQSWYRTIGKDSSLISRWVMPYRSSARISLLNTGDKPVSVSVQTVTSKWAWDAQSMYFHANWKSEENVVIKQNEENKPIEWDLNAINGKGVFIGDALAVYNHMHKWYGEGDQKLWVDGERFPAEFGTGTEDYYNTSWAPVVLYQTPFANAPRADNPDSFGHNTFTRTRNLDAVPFEKNFRYSLEMIGWENGTADFAATTYWYGFKNAKSKVAEKQSQPTLLPTTKQ
ncbi:glycoside hydrolase family 172 protein [Mucilaginibacter kameinonensis]|uniref:glycoside hydrolase family 172 protein n=1 Tax=Mucilaginibacter kameinonensis TaxID=452286 RepID=UPI000EF81123|nr:glycoside hydrolase family 172 protein [Mucilaginibacter kameinonensis]